MDRTEAQLLGSIAIIHRYGITRGNEIMREIARTEDDCAACPELHPAVVHCVACGMPVCADATDRQEIDHCKACGAWARQHEVGPSCPECGSTHGGCGCWR